MYKHDFNKESLKLHRKYKGKIEVVSKIEVNTTDDLSRIYSPGVAAPCLAILKGGAAIIATRRSDYPNQVNNVLAFPGIFRGALDCRAKRITPKMKIAAVYAIADCVKHPNRENIIPKF